MKHMLKKLLDLILPPLCPLCKKPVVNEHSLCADCFKKLEFIGEPCCHICGRPFSFDVLGDRTCAQCLATPPLFTQAKSVAIYDDISKKLILAFKHGASLDLLPLLSKLMLLRGQSLVEQADLIIPVPLHRFRLLKRKYNQSALLAKHIAKHSQKTCAPDGLKRIRSTPTQGKLSPTERKKNVANAFRINPRLAVKDKTVLLIDDVLTTGATANECSRILIEAGAKQVLLLTFASTAPHFQP